jgi:hypothetical protein
MLSVLQLFIGHLIYFVLKLMLITIYMVKARAQT